MANTKQVKGADRFTDSATYHGGDGVPLFSAAHPTIDGTQSNVLSAADLNSEDQR